MKLNLSLSIALIAVSFLAFSLFNSLLFSGVRLDLTENRLYSLSDGTKEVLEEIDEPINLYFFFSSSLSGDLTGLRAYASRVEALLREYELGADSKINLKVIDPVPFSEEEDLAAEFGLQGVPVGQSGDTLYFGLAGTNAVDGEEVIGFFQPDRESLLEYELTKLVHALSTLKSPVLGIYSSLDIDGGLNPQTYQQADAWVFYDQLGELFDVRMLETLDESSLSEIELLMLVHPKDISEEGLFAVDQHVMEGGRLIAFVDPMAESDNPPPTGGMNIQAASASSLNRLTSAWGVRLREGEILADAGAALMVVNADGQPVRHLGIPGFGVEQISRDDIVTSGLESLNFSTAGILDVDMVQGIRAEPLITSSTDSASLPVLQFQFLTDPEELLKGFVQTGERYVTAVRLTGSASSAFPGRKEGALAATDALNVVLIADTDVMTDRLWVRVDRFFGQSIASAFADNGSFIVNLTEQMLGSSALIDVRSRGQFTRPFTAVESIRREAEEKYLSVAEDLQAQLNETEARLSELESVRVDEGLLTLSPEQEAALESFQQEKLRIRKELREVRHQLDEDIEHLGSALKFLNILLLPMILVGILLAFRVMRVHRHEGRNGAAL